MISYKQWKLLQENLDGVIGISTPSTVGVVSENPMIMGMKKRMGADVPPPPEEDMDDDEDDEDEDDHPHDEEGEDVEGDEEGEDEEGDEEGDEDDEDGDDEGDMGMGGPGMGGPGMGIADMLKKKKPMPGKMNMNYMKKEVKEDPQDKEMKAQNKKKDATCMKYDKKLSTETPMQEAKDKQDEEMIKKTKGSNMEFKSKGGCAKCGMSSKKSKKCCKMTKEEREFNDSLRDQLGISGNGTVKFEKDEYGYWIPVKEEVLLPVPEDTNEQENEEPQAGEVGFAPQGRIGGVVGRNFSEWTARHLKAAKKKMK